MDEGFILFVPQWLLDEYHGLTEPIEGSIEELQERQYELMQAMAFMRVKEQLHAQFPGWPIALSPLDAAMFEDMEDADDDDDSLTPL